MRYQILFANLGLFSLLGTIFISFFHEFPKCNIQDEWACSNMSFLGWPNYKTKKTQEKNKTPNLLVVGSFKYGEETPLRGELEPTCR